MKTQWQEKKISNFPNKSNIVSSQYQFSSAPPLKSCPSNLVKLENSNPLLGSQMNALGFDFYKLNKYQKKREISDRHCGSPILPHPKQFQISHFNYVKIKGKCQNIFSLIPTENSKQLRTHPIPRVLTSNKDSHRKHNK